MPTASKNGKHPDKPKEPPVGIEYQGEVPNLPVSGLFSEGAPPPSDYVVHLEKLVEAFMKTDNMRLRTNITRRIMIHMTRCETLKTFAEERGFKKTAARCDEFAKYIREGAIGIDNLGMKNLIAGMQAARPSPYNGLEGEHRGLLGRTRDRIMGKV